MKGGRRFSLLVVAAAIILAGVAAYVAVSGRGWDARERPGALETSAATRLRALAMPDEARERPNPVPASDEVFRAGLEHFADHCAICHANDGSGDTDFGRGLYPKPPDLAGAATQALTDGALFYIIERGVPLTGMPGFGTGRPDGELASWHLVHFIRRIPALTDEQLAEMAELNPMPAEAWRQRADEQEFLRGGEPPPPRPPIHRHKEPQ